MLTTSPARQPRKSTAPASRFRSAWSRHSKHWGTDDYFVDHPSLTEAAAERLVAAGVACVGIDSLNIDSTATGQRPVHTTLLRNDIPIIEHLAHLDQLPLAGFLFTAVLPKIEGCGTFTVRAYATLL